MRVAILGGGASGTLLAAELLRMPEPVDLAVVEPRGELGPGLAYSTPDGVHLLNVRAGRMSGRADDPNHFLRWLRRHDPSAHEGAFARRESYGRYLVELLSEARGLAHPESRLAHLRSRAMGIRASGAGARVLLSEGGGIEADAVVLALGNLPPAAFPPLRTGGADPRRFVADPWRPGALDAIRPDEPVLLMGSGLTAMDVALSLRARGHRGGLTAVSRHGLVPKTQAFVQPPLHAESHPVAPEWMGSTRRLRRLVHVLRAEARRQVAAEGDWHGLFETLRPITPALWRGLPLDDQRCFLRHVRPYWDVHRHRIAPDVAESVRQMIRSGGLAVRAGRVVAFKPHATSLRVSLVPRRASTHEELEVGHVVSCTGPGAVATTRHPLLRGLLADALVRPDPLGLGLDALPDGRLLGRDGRHPLRLFALGPLLKGTFWETTAVPEIRVQAARLARRLRSSVELADVATNPGLTSVL